MEAIFFPWQFWPQRTIEQTAMLRILQHSQKMFLPNYLVLTANLPSSKPLTSYKLQLPFSNIALQGFLKKKKGKRQCCPQEDRKFIEDFQYNL